MPDNCRFRGIVIRMRLRDHAPPHFQAFYGEYSASIEIGTHTLMKGRLPPRIRRMVESWGECVRTNFASPGNKSAMAKLQVE